MFIIEILAGITVAGILSIIIPIILEEIPKIPIHIRITISIAFVIAIFFFLKELTGVSSFWDIINLNALKNLYEMKKN